MYSQKIKVILCTQLKVICNVYYWILFTITPNTITCMPARPHTKSVSNNYYYSIWSLLPLTLLMMQISQY